MQFPHFLRQISVLCIVQNPTPMVYLRPESQATETGVSVLTETSIHVVKQSVIVLAFGFFFNLTLHVTLGWYIACY